MTSQSLAGPPINPFAFVRRHFGKMALTFLLVLGAAVAYTATSTRLYPSEAKVFVRLGRESVALDVTATTGQTVSVQESREQEINSVLELLKSRAVLEQVADEIGIGRLLGKPDMVVESEPMPEPSVWQQLNPLATYSLRDKALKRLAKRFKVDVVRKSNIINVSCEAPSPDLAQEILQDALDAALDIHLRVNHTDGSYEFFAAEAQQQAERLSKLETELRDLKNKTGVSAVTPQREIHLKRVAGLEDDRLQARAELQALQAEIANRREALAAEPKTHITAETTGNPQTAAAHMREQLYALELKEKELSTRYQDDTFIVQQVRQQVTEARELLEKEGEPTQTTKALNEAHQKTRYALMESDAKASSLAAQLESIDEQLAEARSALRGFNEDELRMVRLEREIELEQASYRKYSENRELSRIDQELQRHSISNLNILQPPTRSVTPSRPRVALNLALGILAAALAAVSVAGIAELRRHPSLYQDHDLPSGPRWEVLRGEHGDVAAYAHVEADSGNGH